MKFLTKLAVSIALLCPLLAAQEMVVGIRVHPGDPIRVLVRFKASVAPAEITARLQLAGPLKKDQSGFPEVLEARDLKKISEREYEVSGKVPNRIASGQYRLTQIYVNAESLTRVYNAGTDFQGDVTVEVSDDQHSSFPEIDEVRITK